MTDIYIDNEKIIADLEEEIKRLKKELNETTELLLYPKIETKFEHGANFDFYIHTKFKMPIRQYEIHVKEWIPEKAIEDKGFVEYITLNNTKQIAIEYFERGLKYWAEKEKQQNEEERIFENE